LTQKKKRERESTKRHGKGHKGRFSGKGLKKGKEGYVFGKGFNLETDCRSQKKETHREGAVQSGIVTGNDGDKRGNTYPTKVLKCHNSQKGRLLEIGPGKITIRSLAIKGPKPRVRKKNTGNLSS